MGSKMTPCRGRMLLGFLAIIGVSQLADGKQLRKEKLESELSNEVDLGPAYPSPHKQAYKWRSVNKNRDTNEIPANNHKGRVQGNRARVYKDDPRSSALQKIGHVSVVNPKKQKAFSKITKKQSFKPNKKKNKMFKKLMRKEKNQQLKKKIYYGKKMMSKP